MGRAWRLASFIPNSCIHCGSWKEACTSLASFLQSSIPGTADNLVHQSGVLHFLAFHGTHWLDSKTVGSGGILLPSSSEVSGNPLKKDATAGPSSGGSYRSEPLPVAPSSLDPVFGPVGQLGAGGLQTTPDGVSYSAFPYFIPGSPYSWISPLFLSSSVCNLTFLSLL